MQQNFPFEHSANICFFAEQHFLIATKEEMFLNLSKTTSLKDLAPAIIFVSGLPIISYLSVTQDTGGGGVPHFG